MPKATVLCNNIFRDGKKYVRGDQFEASKADLEEILNGDEYAGRAPRIAIEKRTQK